MHLIAIPVRMPGFGHLAGRPCCPEIRQRGILDETMGDVDPETVDVPSQPVPEHVVELGADLLVRPVQIGLLGSEQMQVPLPGRSVRIVDARPCAAAETAPPVVRRLVADWPAAVAEHVSSPCRTVGRSGEGRLEPWVSDEVWLGTMSMMIFIER